MSTPPTPAKANEPLVTNEWIDERHQTYGTREAIVANRAAMAVRDIYEADRTKLLADLAAMREAGDRMREALSLSVPVGNIAFNLAQSHRAADTYINDVKRLDEARRESCNAWDALTPPR